MKIALRSGWLPLASILLFALRAPGADAPDPRSTRAADVEFFESRIRPVLAEHCYSCHSDRAEKLKAGLRVDSRQALLEGGESGPSLVPGQPDTSRLLRAIGYEDPDLQMPPKSRLPPQVVDDFRKWIAGGAPWGGSSQSPGNTPTISSNSSSRSFDLAQRRQNHWAWKPVVRPNVPAVRNIHWAVTDIDRFILARLEEKDLKPAPRASRTALIRRVSFLLTGLPPAPEAVRSFVRDPGSDREALAKVVDHYLGSQHFGEHWARHWLDKVRYAETMGHEFDYPIQGAWRYRDYLIRAFNQDLPYDDFTREQIAGDVLSTHRINPDDGTDESLLATAQFWFCQQVHSPVDVRAQQAETVDNQIDVVSKAFLGMTVSCARCHDHKFDAVSTRDYYALHGILSSSRHAFRAVDSPKARLGVAEKVRARRSQLPRLLAPILAEYKAKAEEAASPAKSSPVLGPLALRPEDLRIADEGWFADGEAFLPDSRIPGQVVVLGDGSARIVQPGWTHSAALGRRFQGWLRSPTFTLERDFLHLRIAGQGSRLGVVVEGFTLLRSPIYGSLRRPVQNPEAHWVTIDVSMWKGRRAWLDFADLSEADPATELSPDSRRQDGWIAFSDAVLSNVKEPPPLNAVPKETPSADWIRHWAESPGDTDSHRAVWLDGLLAQAGTNLPPDLLRPLRELDASLQPPVLVSTMSDGTGVDEPVFIRGNHRTPGPIVPRRFLEAIPSSEIGVPEHFHPGSGRLQLANSIASAKNPLFARTHVNWVWGHLLGRGLAASVDNLGVLGEGPTHPELLDWLADGFQLDGFSSKRLIRRILLSETWQMSSRESSEAAVREDPDNILLHRAHLRRIEAESIRDSLLMISGRLNPQIGGEPVPVHLTPFMDGRGRPGSSGPLDGEGRRTLYIEVRRNFLLPFMLAFDQPVPATTVGKRTISNVPAQSLALMNDPLVVGEARRWAERTLREVDGTTEERIGRLFAQAYAREPEAGELRTLSSFLDARLTQQSADLTAAWTDLCHALLNAKEFIFLQ